MWPTSAAPWHLESASPSPCRLRLYPHSNYGPVSPGRGPYGERCSGSSLCVCLPVCLPSVVCLFPLLALPVSFTHLCYHKRPAPGGAGPAYIPVCPPLCLCPATCPIRLRALFCFVPQALHREVQGKFLLLSATFGCTSRPACLPSKRYTMPCPNCPAPGGAGLAILPVLRVPGIVFYFFLPLLSMVVLP